MNTSAIAKSENDNVIEKVFAGPYIELDPAIDGFFIPFILPNDNEPQPLESNPQQNH